LTPWSRPSTDQPLDQAALVEVEAPVGNALGLVEVNAAAEPLDNRELVKVPAAAG